MQKLEEAQFSLAEPLRLGRAGLGNHVGRVMDEEGLLRLDFRGGKPVFRKSVDQPIPADVAGDVLLARTGEKIVGLGMMVIGARGAGGRGLDEFAP